MGWRAYHSPLEKGWFPLAGKDYHYSQFTFPDTTTTHFLTLLTHLCYTNSVDNLEREEGHKPHQCLRIFHMVYTVATTIVFFSSIQPGGDKTTNMPIVNPAHFYCVQDDTSSGEQRAACKE